MALCVLAQSASFIHHYYTESSPCQYPSLQYITAMWTLLELMTFSSPLGHRQNDEKTWAKLKCHIVKEHIFFYICIRKPTGTVAMVNNENEKEGINKSIHNHFKKSKQIIVRYPSSHQAI